MEEPRGGMPRDGRVVFHKGGKCDEDIQYDEVQGPEVVLKLFVKQVVDGMKECPPKKQIMFGWAAGEVAGGRSSLVVSGLAHSGDVLAAGMTFCSMIQKRFGIDPVQFCGWMAREFVKGGGQT